LQSARLVAAVAELLSLDIYFAMKIGPLIGYLGCALFLVSFIIRDKEYEVTQVVLGLSAMFILTVATIITGIQKGRPWIGVGLSLVSWLYGIGFIIMLFVPKKEPHHAEPCAGRARGPGR
jgi:hypothetical protein